MEASITGIVLFTPVCAEAIASTNTPRMSTIPYPAVLSTAKYLLCQPMYAAAPPCAVRLINHISVVVYTCIQQHLPGYFDNCASLMLWQG